MSDEYSPKYMYNNYTSSGFYILLYSLSLNLIVTQI